MPKSQFVESKVVIEYGELHNMGYYIQTKYPQNKARQIVEDYGANLVLSPDSFDFAGPNALICIVENPNFDAAAIAYNAAERDYFNSPDDDRPKVWLSLPKSKAIELCPLVKDEFNRPVKPRTRHE
jgi:hypothetical protein